MAVVPVAFTVADQLLEPEARRRLERLETYVVSVLHADIAGGQPPDVVAPYREARIHARLATVAAAANWSPPKDRRLHRISPRQRVVALCQGSTAWRHRARITSERSDFERAQALAHEALSNAGGDPALEASALFHRALAYQEWAEHDPDLIVQTTAQIVALEAGEAVHAVAKDQDPRSPDFRAACDAMTTLLRVRVRAAERVRSERAVEETAEAAHAAGGLLDDAGLGLSPAAPGDLSDIDGIAIAVRYLLAYSRLTALRHAVTPRSDASLIDEAIGHATSAYALAEMGESTYGMAESAVVLSRQVLQAHAGERIPDELGETLVRALTFGLLHSDCGSLDCVRLLAAWAELLSGWEAQVPEQGYGVLASLIFTSACEELQTRAPEACAEVALQWVRIEEEFPARGMLPTAYGYALGAGRRLARAHSIEGHRSIMDILLGPLHSHAAVALAEAGRGPSAVEGAESGRSATLRATLAPPERELAELEARGAKDLRDRYVAAVEAERQTVEAERAWDAPVPPGPVDEMAASLDRVAAAAARRRELEEEIRGLPGLEGFPSDLSFDEIRAAAGAAPLAYIAAGPRGGSLLVVRSGRSDPEHVPLPAFTREALEEHALGLITAYREWDPAAGWDRGWPALLDTVGAWLWDAAIGPLAETLGDAFVRVVPMSLLAAMPLQCAWTEEGGARVYAIDRLTLSRVPSAAALRAAGARAPAEGGRAVLVDDPDDDFAGSREIEAAAARFGSSATRLRGAEADPAAVREALRSSAFAHVSAHGSVDESNPRRSAIALAGGALTLDDIREVPDARLDLLVLSSCESAMAGGRSLDQVLSFPGLAYGSAARAVVAAEWAVDVDATSRLFERFYAHWKGDADPRSSAAALRAAQRDLRDAGEQRRHPLWWGGFVHVG